MSSKKKTDNKAGKADAVIEDRAQQVATGEAVSAEVAEKAEAEARAKSAAAKAAAEELKADMAEAEARAKAAAEKLKADMAERTGTGEGAGMEQDDLMQAGQVLEKQAQELPEVDGVWGRFKRRLRDGREGVEPFLTEADALAAAKKYGLQDVMPFRYQFAWVLVGAKWRKWFALAAGKRPFRTATEARRVIRLNPELGERKYEVLPWGDGFCVVPRALELILRCCYPSYVRFTLSSAGAHDPDTVQANSSGNRMVFTRGKAVSAPFGVFQALRDAQGPVVKPETSPTPGHPGFKVEGITSKFPMQTVQGAVSEQDHMAVAEAGRELRRMQLERDAEDRLAVRAPTGFERLDGSRGGGESFEQGL